MTKIAGAGAGSGSISQRHAGPWTRIRTKKSRIRNRNSAGRGKHSSVSLHFAKMFLFFSLKFFFVPTKIFYDVACHAMAMIFCVFHEVTITHINISQSFRKLHIFTFYDVHIKHILVRCLSLITH